MLFSFMRVFPDVRKCRDALAYRVPFQKTIGSLRNDDGDGYGYGYGNVTWKVNFRCLRLYRAYSL